MIIEQQDACNKNNTNLYIELNKDKYIKQIDHLNNTN